MLNNPSRITGKERFRQQRSENLVGEDEPWYDSGTFIPTYRDAMLAQGEYTSSGLRELFMGNRREQLRSRTNPSCVCVGCKCPTCTTSNRAGYNCTGCSCANCSCRVKPERMINTSRREHFLENANDAAYSTDPRFLVGTAELHFNVGSDVNDITRVYGTVDQRRYYPKLTDYINYGVASVMEPSK